MNKNRIRLTESQLHRIIKESVKRILKEEDVSKIPTAQLRGKRYVDDRPKKQSIVAGDYSKDWYDTEINSDEFDRLSSYDDDFGYDFRKGNPEPICYDPIEGPCYDSGDYEPRDVNLQKSFAQYAHNNSDIPSLAKDNQNSRSWYEFEKNKPDFNKPHFDKKRDMNYDRLMYGNFNTRNRNGKLAMDALEDPNGFGAKLHGSTLNDLGLDESIRRAIRKALH